METNILFESMMEQVKEVLDTEYKRDTQKVRCLFDIAANTSQQFYKFEDSDEMFTSGAVPCVKDVEGSKLKNHFMPSIKKRMIQSGIGIKEILFFEMIFDLVEKKISKCCIYYINLDGEDKKYTA